MRQRSEEWILARAGNVTGSRLKDIVKLSTKGKPLKPYFDYLAEIVAERLTSEPVSKSHGLAGKWGTDVEEYALAMYEVKMAVICQDIGFAKHPSIEWVGVSPDSFVGDDGGVEIKCPINSAVHLTTIINQTMPEEHIPQVQGCMWVTDRKWWDFVSFDPRMPDHLQLFVQRIARDEAYIHDMERMVKEFLANVLKTLDQLHEAA